MELTLDILLHFIADLQPRYLHRALEPSLFVGVKRFFAEMEREQSDEAQYLYLAEPEELLQNRAMVTPNMTILTVGDAESEAIREASELPCTLILVEDAYPLPYLLNRMIDVFSVMSNCDKAMHISALEGKSVQTLLDFCEDLLGHPTIIFDSGFNVLAYTRHLPCEYELFCETIRNGYTDSKVMRRLQENKIFSQLKEDEALVAPAMGAEQQTNIYLKFSGTQALLGYASVYFGEDQPDRGYLDMLRLFMKNVRFCLRRDFEGSHYGQMMYETFLMNLMNPSGVSEEQLAEQAKNIGNLPLTGRFVLAVVELSDEEVPLPFLTRIMAQEMWSVKPFLYDGQICLLKTLGEDAPPDRLIEPWEWENMLRILGNRQFVMGISNAFFALIDLRFAYVQAKAAAAFCEEGKRYSLYGDIYYDHLFSLLEREMPVRLLQPEFYTRIKAFDAEHKTDYLRILLVYLECGCNATHAADQLFLHRNTVHNAVLFAEEHWGVRMEDPDIQKKLVLADLADRYLNRSS